MTGINIVTKIFIILAVIIVSEISPCYSAISDRRLCFDQRCSVPVSMATTVMAYGSNDPGIMSFKSNVEVTVFSKSAGKRQDLWGVEINGKRGYVPLNLLREKKVYKRNLIHDVPTENIVENIIVDDSKNQEIQKDKDVPNNMVKSEDSIEKIVAEPIEKINVINHDSKLSSSSVLNHVSPSYEIHDGTTISLVENDEPVKPSYATQIPQGIQNIEEQPILSIHPSISSTFTVKTGEIPIEKIVNDAETYLEVNSLKDQSLSEKVLEEPTTELPLETFQQSSSFLDLNYTVEENSLDSITNTETIDNVVTDDTKKQSTVISSHESIEKTLENDDNTNIIANDIGNTEKKPDILNNDADNNEKTNGIENYTTEQSLHSEKIQNIIVETSTDNIATKENHDDSISVDDSNINILKNITTEIINNSESVDNAIVTKNIDSKETEVTDEKFIDDEESEDEDDEDDDLSEEDDESPEIEANIEQNKDSIPVELEPPVEEPIEEKPTEELPPSNNINIMNPLFNRLSMIPTMVKEMVEKTLSSDNSDKKSNNEDSTIVAESEIENLNVNEEIIKDIETTLSSVDFSTDNNSINDYQNKNDNLISVTNNFEENTKNTELENIDNKYVNINNITDDNVETKNDKISNENDPVQPGIYKEDEIAGFRQDNFAVDVTSSFNGFPGNRNLLNVGNGLQNDDRDSIVDSSEILQIEKSIEINDAKIEGETINEKTLSEENIDEKVDIPTTHDSSVEREISDTCLLDSSCENSNGDEGNHNLLHEEIHEEQLVEDPEIIKTFTSGRNYWETLTYLVVTAFTTLIFSLGYYYIENTRRDGQLIAKINKLEHELLVSSKECIVLDDTLKSTKTKLDSIEDESFGSNEMVLSLKTDLEASKAAKSELEDQVSMLEKELESATEAGLELERMLREILSTNNQDNPLAQSIEDLQTRLNAQQAANEALTNALNLKAQENETLTADLAGMTQKCEQLEVEITRVTEELKHQNNIKSNLEQTLLDKVSKFEKQVKDISAERINLRNQLKGKEMELTDLLEIVNQMNINNIDFDKLYNVSKVKAEASQLLEERDDLQIKLSEVEGAHQLLEEHVKIINEEVSSLSEQCKLAEKAKRDAETRVEVLSNFFKEKEAQRQKEEAVWLQKQGEVSSTVERLQTMQNEIHNYKQQIEMLKREILDQEREYKNQISGLETKSHEHWVVARQNERRLEESKAEAGQLRNRLTLIEKNLNDADPEAKLHRLEANGETATSPQLFIGAEASSSPIMFTGSSGVPFPPPPSYLYGPPPPPFLPPPTHPSSGISPYEVGQRPPPLGGRLSSPPPLPGSGSGRYDNPRSPPPPLSPSMLPPYGPPHRAYPPPFSNDRIHPPPPHSSMLPPPLGPSTQSWGNETLPHLRNSGYHPHQHHQRDQQRPRNHKGSLHSSGESLDKNV